MPRVSYSDANPELRAVLYRRMKKARTKWKRYAWDMRNQVVKHGIEAGLPMRTIGLMVMRSPAAVRRLLKQKAPKGYEFRVWTPKHRLAIGLTYGQKRLRWRDRHEYLTVDRLKDAVVRPKRLVGLNALGYERQRRVESRWRDWAQQKQAGKSVASIAKRYKVKTDTVYNALRRLAAMGDKTE